MQSFDARKIRIALRIPFLQIKSVDPIRFLVFRALAASGRIVAFIGATPE